MDVGRERDGVLIEKRDGRVENYDYDIRNCLVVHQFRLVGRRAQWCLNCILW